MLRLGFCFGPTIRSGLSLARLRSTVVLVEELGFDSLWFFNRTSPTLPDVLTLLMDAAVTTSRLMLGPCVLVASGHDPVARARQLLAIHRVSRGRLIVGLGLGDGTEAVFRDRKEAATSIERLIGALAADRPCAADRRPPIWLGGRSRAMLMRVAALADGWIPSFITPAEFRAGCQVVRDFVSDVEAPGQPAFAVQVMYLPPSVRHLPGLCESLARDVRAHRPDAEPGEIYVFGGHDELIARVESFAASGADHVLLTPAFPPRDWREDLGAMRERLGHLV